MVMLGLRYKAIEGVEDEKGRDEGALDGAVERSTFDGILLLSQTCCGGN
jgi:hypothetical protein